MKRSSASDQQMAECLCALMLLENLSDRQILTKLMEARRDAVAETIQKYHKSLVSLGDAICDAVKIYRSTLFQATLIFTASSTGDSHSMLNQVIGRVTQQPSAESGNNSAPMLVSLFNSTKTDVHVLLRYLPETLRHFTPRVTTSGFNLSDQDALGAIQDWSKSMDAYLVEQLDKMLVFAQSGKTLANARGMLWEVLRRDHNPISTNTTNTPVKKQLFEWSHLCTKLFKKPVSLWHDVLQPVFLRRASQIVEESFKAVLERLNVVVEDQYDRVQNRERGDRDVEAEDAVGKYMWSKFTHKQHQPQLPSRTPKTPSRMVFRHTWKDVGSPLTPLLAAVIDEMDKLLLNLKQDLAFIDGQKFIDTKEQLDAWVKAEEDAQKIRSKSMEECRRFLAAIRDRLKQQSIKLWDLKHPIASLFVARLCLELVPQSKQLSFFLVDTQSSSSQLPQTQRNARLTLMEKRTHAQLQPLIQEFEVVYMDLFDRWADTVLKEFQQKLNALLHERHWHELGYLVQKMNQSQQGGKSNNWVGGTWEVCHRATTNDQGQKSEDVVYLPAHPSVELVQLLLHVCDQIQDACGYASKRTMMQKLVERLLAEVFDTIQSFAGENPWKTVVAAEKVAFQLYFDFLFIWRSLKGAVDAKKTTETFKRFTQVRETIKALLDPIEFALYEEELNANVERAASRYTLLLYSLTQFNSVAGSAGESGIKSSAKSFLYEQHHLIVTLPATPRFTLLPSSFALTPTQQPNSKV